MIGMGKTLSNPPLTLRAARVDDAEQIAAIWNREVLETDHTTDTEPRDPLAQRTWLAARGGDHPVVVAVVGDEVVGYGALSAYRPKPAFRRTVEDSVYVKVGHRGRGVGAGLLERLLALARAQGHHAVIARVTAGNTPSIALHERYGFVRIGVERQTASKGGRWLDVVVLEQLLG
jgi:L-amino acid N-acyltransferase YncA